MKLTIQKTFTAVVDTSVERRRITKAFRNDPVTRRKLRRLMDAIEAQDWKGAGRQLESKWWQGRDPKLGCSRYEFIGLVFRTPVEGFDVWASYASLVSNFTMRPENYKVTATQVR